MSSECMRPDCVAQVCEYESRIAELKQALTELEDERDQYHEEVEHKNKVIELLAQRIEDIAMKREHPEDILFAENAIEWAEAKENGQS